MVGYITASSGTAQRLSEKRRHFACTSDIIIFVHLYFVLAWRARCSRRAGACLVRSLVWLLCLGFFFCFISALSQLNPSLSPLDLSFILAVSPHGNPANSRLTHAIFSQLITHSYLTTTPLLSQAAPPPSGARAGTPRAASPRGVLAGGTLWKWGKPSLAWMMTAPCRNTTYQAQHYSTDPSQRRARAGPL